MIHQSVLLKEVIDILKPFESGIYIDCTLGAGGYSKEILKNIPDDGCLVSIDLEKRAVDLFREYLYKNNLREKAEVVRDNFANIDKIGREISEDKNMPIKGVVMDLGLSLDEIQDSGRGFSFMKDEPLLMTFGNPDDYEYTAKDVVNSFSLDELTRIFRIYGEEESAHEIASAILKARKRKKISTTFDLVDIIENIKKTRPHARRRLKIHPATKIFQALRIAVNDEIEVLKKAINSAIPLLDKKGKLAVVSFHGIEDRTVKHIFKKYFNDKKVDILTDKPIIPSTEEVKTNPKSRSAKLRAVIKK